MIWSIFRLAFREIGRNLMRSSLTVLGIVIGVAAVISMVTLGEGATEMITDEISGMGSNMLIIRPGTQQGPGGVRASASPFEASDAEAIALEIPSVAAVAPTTSSSAIAVYGNENWSTSVLGTANGYLDVRDWSVAAGRPFNDGELRAGKLSCMLGATVQEELFGYQDPLGASIRLGNVSCKVIAVLESKGESTFGADQDDFVLMPLRAIQRRFTGNQDVAMIFVSAINSDATTTAKQEIEELLRQRRRIKANEEDDFNVMDMAEIATTMENTTGILTTFLGAVAAISLLVGGIGIMNIMLVSVTERTREVGIRLAIGALSREVLMQFLVEAMMLSLFGGILGVGMGIGLAAIAATMLNLPFVFNSFIAIVAFLFSGVVGVIFGYFPARRAAHLDPIDALRYE